MSAIGGEIGWKNPDRDLPLQLRVGHTIDLAHTAGAERTDDFYRPTRIPVTSGIEARSIRNRVAARRQDLDPQRVNPGRRRSTVARYAASHATRVSDAICRGGRRMRRARRSVARRRYAERGGHSGFDPRAEADDERHSADH